MRYEYTKPVPKGRVAADGPALDNSEEPRQVTIWFRNIDGTKGKVLPYFPRGNEGGNSHWAAQIGAPCYNLTVSDGDIMDWNTFTFESQDHETGHAVGDGYEWKKYKPYSYTTSLNRYQIDAIAKSAIDYMYKAGDYHFLYNNCQHFITHMCKEIMDAEPPEFTADQNDDTDRITEQFQPPLHAVRRPPNRSAHRRKHPSLPRTGPFVRISRSAITPSRIRDNYSVRKSYSRKRMQATAHAWDTRGSDSEESPSDGESELRGTKYNAQPNDQDNDLPDQLAYEQGERGPYVYPLIYSNAYAGVMWDTDSYFYEVDEEATVHCINEPLQSNGYDDGSGFLDVDEHGQLIMYDDLLADEGPDQFRLSNQVWMLASRTQAYNNRLSEHDDEFGSTTDCTVNAEWQIERTMTGRKSGPRRRRNRRTRASILN